MVDRVKSARAGIAGSGSVVGPGQASLIASPHPGVSFTVDDVQPATKPLWQSTLGESLELRSGASILIMPDRLEPALAPEGYHNQSLDQRTGEPMVPLRAVAKLDELQNSASGNWADSHTFLHPLVQAIHLAFSDHRPLVLSPNCIWLTIIQGFAQHIRENAESLRNRLVQHHGKASLRVETLSLDPDHWPELISEFSARIRAHSDPILHETLLCDFSTTTPRIRTACEIALMDAYQRYFKYILRFICGIPVVTLQGTVEDWQRLRDRVEVLATYNLDWWTLRLTPILDEFVTTAKGQPNRSFWQAIYKPARSYSSDLASGWITDLFPYVTDPFPDRGPHHKSQRNPMLEVRRIDWLPSPPQGKSQTSRADAKVGISLGSFPNGLSRAPVQLEFGKAFQSKVELLGGFLGVSQRPQDNALAPIISWALVKADPRPRPSLNLH